MGLIANNPTHLAGAIDADGADKAARFMQLCDAYDLPILFLCDTPGIMVGPEVEKTALVRHVSRMFVTGGSLTVPFFTIILRKGYGLGAQTMAGGSFKSPIFTVSWPTGEFGGMGLEGAVRLGYRKELEAVDDPLEREADNVAAIISGTVTNSKPCCSFHCVRISSVASTEWLRSQPMATLQPSCRRITSPPRICFSAFRMIFSVVTPLLQSQSVTDQTTGT